MKMHKNCCHQSCSFWFRYSPQTPLGELTARSPIPPSWFGGGAPWEREGGRGEGKEGGIGRKGMGDR